jgi:hypothetical protein
MKIIRLTMFAILFSLTPVLAGRAQTNERLGEGGRTQELVEHLKEVIRGAEQERRSSVAITRQLKDLVRRYDWPWKVSLLYDDFRDGDYTHNPRWVVAHGDFRVARGAGLRSHFEPPQSGTYRTSDRRGDNPALEILSDILLGSRERIANEPQAGSNSEAEIYTRAGISNGFALKVELTLRNYGNRNTGLEFGPFQGDERGSGYRLAYESGPTPSLSLLRFGPSRSAVIERVDQGIVLDDAGPHTFEWRRHNDGEMLVLLNDREVMRTVDRAYADAFDGFAVVNKGGEFEIKKISILGTRP